MGSLDLPEYFPPAGEAPPAAPEMAAAALEMVIFFKAKSSIFVKIRRRCKMVIRTCTFCTAYIKAQKMQLV